ncbi:MAG: hypothetical protein JXQ23_05375 [Clostridia bacterium]|nr:hypothetical protein [Clostridia bacterium]
MSGLDLIIEKIITQANTQADNEMQYVKTQIDKQLSEQKSRFERGMEIEINHAKAKGEEEYKRVIASAMLESRKNILNQKVEIINDVFSQALQKLSELPEQEYIDLLIHISKASFEKGANTIILNERDQKTIGKKLAAKLKEEGIEVQISDETNKSLGGLIVKNGQIQTNLTFESIIRAEREKLESEVVRMLFEGSR